MLTNVDIAPRNFRCASRRMLGNVGVSPRSASSPMLVNASIAAKNLRKPEILLGNARVADCRGLLTNVNLREPYKTPHSSAGRRELLRNAKVAERNLGLVGPLHGAPANAVNRNVAKPCPSWTGCLGFRTHIVTHDRITHSFLFITTTTRTSRTTKTKEENPTTYCGPSSRLNPDNAGRCECENLIKLKVASLLGNVRVAGTRLRGRLLVNVGIAATGHGS